MTHAMMTNVNLRLMLAGAMLLATLGCATRQPVAPARVLTTEALYSLRVEADEPRRMYVEADLPISEEIMLVRGATPPGDLMIGDYHPEGPGKQWSGYVEELVVTTPEGAPLPATRVGRNAWNLPENPPRRIRLSYQVRIEHDQHDWFPSDAEGTYNPRGLGLLSELCGSDHLPRGCRGGIPVRASRGLEGHDVHAIQCVGPEHLHHAGPFPHDRGGEHAGNARVGAPRGGASHVWTSALRPTSRTRWT